VKYSYLKETTDYDVEYRVPMHTYIMLGSKCVGYIKEGTEEEILFKKPSVQFNKRGRTFVKVSPS
jgi:hypothetical protein